MLEQLTNKKATIYYSQKISGEPKHTWADISLAQTLLDYEPIVTLKEGLSQEIQYIRSVYQL